MNQTGLKTFIAIVETGSLVKASDRLNVTQSSITMRLKALEEEVGQKLIIRQKSGVALTAAGTKLLSYAQVIDGLWGQALRATSLPQGTSDIINLGCAIALWDIGGSHLFDAMHNHEKGFALSVQQSNESLLLQDLTDGVIDIAMVSEPIVRKSQSSIRLADLDLVLYSDRENTPIRFDKQYIYVDYGADFRRQHDEYYYDAGAAKIGFNTPQMALSYILAYGGSAYLPRALVKQSDTSGQLFEIKDAPIFTMERHLILKEHQPKQWHWLEPLLAEIGLSQI